MNKLLLSIALVAVFLAPTISHPAEDVQKTFTIDENVWVLFYDVPSRRFRRSRDAFVRRDWAAVSENLTVSAAFIRTEASRSVDDLLFPLENVADRLDEIAEGISSTEIAGSDLDAAFARAHWLLSQHYLELAVRARDGGQGRNAGSYLWAAVHHMERTVLWSDARLTRAQVHSLEKLRDLADRLRDGDKPADVFKDKPIALALRTLEDLGQFMDRKIWIKRT